VQCKVECCRAEGNSTHAFQPNRQRCAGLTGFNV
jgi:hypothetical protein